MGTTFLKNIKLSDITMANKWLFTSILLIPFFKIVTSIFNIKTPLYYLPVIALTLAFFTNKKYYTTKFFIINLLILIFSIVGLAHNQNPNSAFLKICIAAFFYINIIYIFYETAHTTSPNNFSTFFDQFYKISLYLSFLFMATCLLAFILNCVFFPFTIPIGQTKDYLLFDRVNIDLRSNLLVRFNPIAMIKNDITNVRYIGQQLLILPITTFGFILLLRKRGPIINVFIALLLISVFLTNSRAMFLTLLIMFLLSYIKKIPQFLHVAYCIICVIFPFSLSVFSSDFTSNRLCQIDFVKSHLTFLGNGIGSYIEDLNKMCGNITEGAHYRNIITTSYDNIHIEFIHYFGMIGYAIFIFFFLRHTLKKNNYACRMLVFLIFIFLSLNFNLFEILFLPILCITYYLSKNYNFLDTIVSTNQDPLAKKSIF